AQARFSAPLRLAPVRITHVPQTIVGDERPGLAARRRHDRGSSLVLAGLYLLAYVVLLSAR
ncbi:MAG TPA: hypothetical protein VHF23_03950, partial [Gaiellaceae bacterium]|nr:hypothetical protein [Gaiellaceae bacterium]